MESVDHVKREISSAIFSHLRYVSTIVHLNFPLSSQWMVKVLQVKKDISSVHNKCLQT